MKYYKRGFLNKKEGMAAFEAETSFESGEWCNSVDGSFAITDCNRKVLLDFCIYNEDDAKNVFFKLSTLIKELMEFEKQLKINSAEYFAHKAQKEKENQNET